MRDEPGADKHIRMRSLDGMALFNRGGTVSPVLERHMKTCHYLTDEIVVTYKGELICNNDALVEESFGNVNTDGLFDIWNSERFKHIRRRVRSGHFDLAVCRRCAQGLKAEAPVRQLVTISPAH